MTGPLPASRFISLLSATPPQIEKLRNTLPSAPCPCCNGTGLHVEEVTEQSINIFGVTLEGTLITARSCNVCEYGRVPLLCPN